MKLKKGTVYTSPTSELQAKVLAIYHETDVYIKAKLELRIRGMLMCRNKTYKLQKKLITDWVPVCRSKRRDMELKGELC